ncbi:MAG TPA: class I SAM-dependent methyltransferase [Elusimicrobia bacterium]|jgi:ubiquinone/menaquinone biosynthesis C-methylase UbiE|nr:class I SAM-dependent methyltransferase [Elusimicrobiota bacterium]
MKLSRIEFLVMNNPGRRWVQKHFEFRIFKDFLKQYNLDLTGKTILDAGCGSGYSSELILKELKPAKLVAFDLMPEQINLAKKRNLNADFFVGDMTKIELPASTFDAVFVFGVLHHIPDWKKALAELSRVLKPEGVLLLEEVKGSFVEAVGHCGFKHPEEAMFNWTELENELQSAGFKILEKRKIVIEIFKSFLCLK